MTGRDMVSAALRLIGAIAPGETPAASEATDGLSALNRMLGSWSNEKLLVNAVVREELTLTPADGSYTMGSSGNLNTSRAIKIESATIENQTSMTESPLIIIRSAQEWAAVTDKESTTEIPTHLFIEGTYPLETLNLYPVPSAAHKLVLYSLKPLTEIATLDTSVSMPVGYDEALVYNLAVRLSPEYGRTTPQEVAMVATDSKSALKRTNHRPALLKVDPAIRSYGGFNIFTGESE